MWLHALSQKEVWLRASKLGVPVGLLQAIINQGDFWLSHSVDSAVITKTIVSPLVTFSVALFSAAGMYIEKTKQQHGKF
jgi:hypothetical protein